MGGHVGVEHQAHHQVGTPLSQFRCAGCGYGASRSEAPDRCPMCGGSEWDYELWRPFSDHAADSPLARDSGL